MTDGFGIGGYGGLAEPWGSIEFPTISSLDRDALNDAYMGIIEAMTGIIGEANNAIDGFRSTRLTTVANISDTAINVESTLGWDTSGKIAIDGVVYYYLGITYNTIYGLSYTYAGNPVIGIAKTHSVDSEVVDLNRNYSAMDKLRRALLVDYAEDEDLRVLGRNLGVFYIPLFGDDDTYREVIKTLAYNPRGTVYGIELVLDVILGSGNYEIYEDLIKHPNEVFIKLTSSYLANDIPIGKTYLSGPDYGVISGSQNTIVSNVSPYAVAYARLKDLGEFFDFRNDIPSAITYSYFEGETPNNAFTYSGSLTESLAIANVSGLYTKFDFPNSPGDDAYYTMTDVQGARITTDSIVELNTVISIPSTCLLTTGALLQISFSIFDGYRNINLGLDQGNYLGLFETEGGGFIGSTKALFPDQFYSVTVYKYKDEYVRLYVDSVLITEIEYSSFTVLNTTHAINFGLQGTPIDNTQFNIKQLGISITGNADLWSSSEDTALNVNSATPSKVTLTGTHTFLASDVGDYFQVKGSGIVNSYGGNNNGKWIISNYLSPTSVSLNPIPRHGINIEAGTFNKLELCNCQKFVYPDDLGKQIEIVGSALGNNGTYIITDLLQEGTEVNFNTFNTPNTEYTNICLVNTGSLLPELDLNYSILPTFDTETGLSFTHSNTGSISGSTLTLRQAVWSNDLVVEVGLSDVLTGQFLQDENEANVLLTASPLTYEYYPFYLADIPGSLLNFLYDLTVAGVIPRIGIM